MKTAKTLINPDSGDATITTPLAQVVAQLFAGATAQGNTLHLSAGSISRGTFLLVLVGLSANIGAVRAFIRASGFDGAKIEGNRLAFFRGMSLRNKGWKVAGDHDLNTGRTEHSFTWDAGRRGWLDGSGSPVNIQNIL